MLFNEVECMWTIVDPEKCFQGLPEVFQKRSRVLDGHGKIFKMDGYDTATITYITDTPSPPSHIPSLNTLHNRVYLKALTWIRTLPPAVQVEITQSLGAFPALEPTWGSLPDGPAWAWWLVPVLPLSAKLQLGFLSTTSLEKRLRAIDKLLDRMEVRMKGVAEVGRVEVKEEGCGRVEEGRYQQQQHMEF